MTLADLGVVVVVLGVLGLGALGLWIAVSRLIWALCVVFAMMARMTEEREVSSDDFMSIAEAYYDRIPFVQK